ncbi:MAG: hypothetical protein ACFFDK_12750 [Promethearchaeota archaeon]
MRKIKEVCTKSKDKFTPMNGRPYCYGNFCEKHLACQKCLVKSSCREIPPPKEPLWCNYE